MSGYIGATTVSFSVTEADIKGDITSTDTSPEVTLQNTTEEDTDGGRESKITFKGEQSGGEISTLAQIQASHDGTADDEKGDLIFSTNDGSDGNTPTERLRIDADGQVGIGTSSPAREFHIASATPQMRLEDTGGGYCDIDGFTGRLTFKADAGNTTSGSFISFEVDASEAARFDSDKNFTVGNTSVINTAGSLNHGFSARPDGRTDISRSSNQPLNLRRGDSGGKILVFYNASGEAGAVYTRTSSNNIAINSANNSGRLSCGGSEKYGWNLTNFWSISDNTNDLGIISNRWDDIYATNATIQTSDQNEKQQIAALTDAEITAAKAISKLFKTFKWNDSVAEKGDAARTHSGVIAQEVEQAMTDAGLDAGDYAFFISSTWWEADETYTDDGVEQTITNTYETLEEAPEGATERNRKGIRYPQLLSFIGAATEQRLASIESRLDALESA